MYKLFTCSPSIDILTKKIDDSAAIAQVLGDAIFLQNAQLVIKYYHMVWACDKYANDKKAWICKVARKNMGGV